MEKMLYFFLARIPLFGWIALSIFYMYHDFRFGLFVLVLLGIPVIAWMLFVKSCFDKGITYKVHLTSKQKRKFKRK